MRVFFNVDTQNDFMKPDGALYVPGAEELIPRIEELTSLAMRHKIQILGSLDVHFGDEQHKDIEGELSKWGGPFPDHCMDGTPGMGMVNRKAMGVKNNIRTDWTGELMSKDVSVITNGLPTFFEKQTYDVFTNRYLKPTLERMNVTEAYVYGVATDYCVKAAVLGLRRLGISVVVIGDAIAAVTPETGQAAMERMARAGAYGMSTADVLVNMEAIYGAM